MALLSRRSPTAGFLQLGTIYKGGKKQTFTDKEGKEKTKAGQDLNYFRFEPKAFSPELRLAWQKHYGEQPTQINFRVLSDTPEEIFDPFFCQFATIKSSPKGRKVLECNGLNIVREMDNKTQELKQVNKPCLKLPDQDHCEKCKPSGVLKLIIPELWSEGFMGYVDIGIKSEYELSDIPANLEGIFTLLTSLNIPMHRAELILQRGDRVVNTKFFKDGSWIPKVETKSLVSIALNPDYLKKIIEEQSRRGNELFGRSQSALPSSTPRIQSVNLEMRSANYGDLLPEIEAIAYTPESQPIPVNFNSRERLIDVCDRLGIAQEDYKTWISEAIANTGSSKKAQSLDNTECETAILQLLTNWGLNQNVWNHDNHCSNSFQKLLEESRGMYLEEIASLWYEKIQEKLNLQTIEPPIPVEAVVEAIALDSDNLTTYKDDIPF
jgi:hypothetical protein